MSWWLDRFGGGVGASGVRVRWAGFVVAKGLWLEGRWSSEARGDG